MDWTNVVLLFGVLLISLTFHEAAHATFALLGGDRTAYYGGQVSLNPLPHIRREPFGTVILPLIGLVASNGTMCLGFASTPIDPIWAYHHPRKAALMSAAGPLANTLLAAIGFAVLYFVEPGTQTGDSVRKIAAVFVLLNVLLGMLNLFPVPPLDGHGVVTGLLPASRRLYNAMAQVPYLGIVLLIAIVVYLLPHLFGPVVREINGWLPYSHQHRLLYR